MGPAQAERRLIEGRIPVQALLELAQRRLGPPPGQIVFAFLEGDHIEPWLGLLKAIEHQVGLSVLSQTRQVCSTKDAIQGCDLVLGIGAPDVGYGISGRRLVAEVPERLQLFQDLGVGRRGSRSCGASRESAAEFGEPVAERGRQRRMCVDNIGALARVAKQVVQLGSRSFYVLELRRDQRAEFVPPERVPGIIGLGVTLLSRRGRFTDLAQK